MGTALLAPLTLVLLAIVLRGVAFGLRSNPRGQARSQVRLGRLWCRERCGAVCVGLVAGGLAQVSSGARAASSPVPPIPWTGLFAVIVGVLAVAICAQLGASFVTRMLTRSGKAVRPIIFARRELQAGSSVLALSVVALGSASWKAPALSHRLTTAALPLVILALAATTASLLALARRRYSLARGANVIATGALMWGWLIAQSPRRIGTHLTIDTAAAAPPALTAVAIAVGIVLLLVLPAVYLLFGVFARPLPEVTE